MQKLSGIIKEYHSDDCLDYAKVQETLGTIYLMTANLPQAKTHFKRAFKIGVISTDWILHWKKSIRSFNKISIIYGGQLARRYIQLFVK